MNGQFRPTSFPESTTYYFQESAICLDVGTGRCERDGRTSNKDEDGKRLKNHNLFLDDISATESGVGINLKAF